MKHDRARWSALLPTLLVAVSCAAEPPFVGGTDLHANDTGGGAVDTGGAETSPTDPGGPLTDSASADGQGSGLQDTRGDDGGVPNDSDDDGTGPDPGDNDVGPVPCTPADCSGNGTCVGGECQCGLGFAGPACDGCADGYWGYPACGAGPWIEAESWIGEGTAAYLGSNGGLSVGPDTDGDGVGDILIGALGVNGSAGGAYLYSGKDGAFLHFWPGEADNDQFGYAVSLGPDATGDGFGDVLIAAPSKQVGEFSNGGKAYLYDGKTGAFVRSWSGSTNYEYLGHDVSLGPDVDGDGLADVLLGTLNGDNAYLYASSDGSLIRSFSGDTAQGGFGRRVRLGPDVSGDGRGDVLVSEWQATVGTMQNAGVVHLYSGLTGADLFTWEGAFEEQRLGLTVDFGPDANDDGKGDVLISSLLAEADGMELQGKVELFASTGALIRKWDGPFAYWTFGVDVALGPDVDGGGGADVLVGTEGAGVAAVLSSETGQLLHVVHGSVDDKAGGQVAFAPDRNGDGVAELLIGTPHHTDSALKQGMVTLHESNLGTCAPGCAGKCDGASDGCGGSCETCLDEGLCVAQFCAPNPCEPDPCSGHGSCDLGQCTCNDGYKGKHCAYCDTGYEGYPACTPLCSDDGAQLVHETATGMVYPGIVYDGTAYGAVWIDTVIPYEAQFARLGSDGTMIGSPVAVSPPDDGAEYPDIAWTGSAYVIVWDQHRDVGVACRDAAGGAIGSLTLTNNASPVVLHRPRVAAGPVWAGVVWADNSVDDFRVYFRRVQPSDCSAVGDAVPLTADYAISPDIAYGGYWGVSWRSDDFLVRVLRLETNGTAVGSPLELGSSTLYFDSRVAYNETDNEFVLTWETEIPGKGWEIGFARGGYDGLQKGDPLTLTDEASNCERPDIAWRDNEIGLTFVCGGKVRFVRTDPSGQVTSPVIDIGANGYAPTITADASGYRLLWEDGTAVWTTHVTCP